jgi:hypothetical protein
MGIGPEPAALLRSLKLPKGFTVVELGSQIFHQGTRSINGKANPDWWRKPARELYESLGCSRYESIDANGHGTLLADLNLPVTPADFGPEIGEAGGFDLTTDFGTGEHIWDIAQVWRTMHALTKPGGYIVFDKPSQGYEFHGFWGHNITVLKDIARANRYEVLHLAPVLTRRGMCYRGVYRKRDDAVFIPPSQGKYKGKLKVGSDAV